MKKILIVIALILFICCLGCIFLITSYKAENLYPINDAKGGGYINKDGKIVIDQKYKFAGRFFGNYAIVQGQNFKEGVINKKGEIVVDVKYNNLDNLSEDFVIYKENKKYGFIDIKRHKEFKAIYDDTKKFKEGLLGVQIKDKWGFVNKNGDLIIQPQYYDVGNFSEGLASISYSNRKTSEYINKKGETVISFEDNNLEPKEFKEGLAPVIKSDENSCSYINKKGKVVIDSKKILPIKIYCGNFFEGLAVFYDDANPRKITTGYIDKRGKVKYSLTFSIPENVSEGEFSAFDDFSSNMAPITIDYRTGYINHGFKIAIPIIYEFARNFEGDLAYVKFEDKEGYINKKGEWVWTKTREGM